MIRCTVLAAALCLFVAPPAEAQSKTARAQTPGTRAGIRAGVSGGPGQFVFGGHYETRPIIEHLTFRPNGEIGIGSNVTLVALNIEFAFWVPIRNHPWWFYLGGGPAAIFAHVHEGGHDQDPFGGGFNFLLGLQHRQGLFSEFKVGFGSSPELKFMVGFAFR